MRRSLALLALAGVGGIAATVGGDVVGALSPVATLSGPARVIDGDTLEIGGERIRLYGVDAFESGQLCGRSDCGRQATAMAVYLTQGRLVSCSVRDRDRYGRAVAVCEAGGRDIGGALVSAGWAVAYTDYSLVYVPAEMRARWDSRGAWRDGFTRPSEYRR